MLSRVISGGQNGVDQAALRAARTCGIETGGWLPKRCKTLDGCNFDLLSDFGMKQHEKEGYSHRTEANVKDSDGTLRIASNFKSPGEICTMNAIRWLKKPYLDVDIKNPLPIAEVEEWIAKNNIKTLNVAGNSENTHTGIGKLAEEYLANIFEKCKKSCEQLGAANEELPLDR
jgi:hypothetical protein